MRWTPSVCQCFVWSPCRPYYHSALESTDQTRPQQKIFAAEELLSMFLNYVYVYLFCIYFQTLR